MSKKYKLKGARPPKTYKFGTTPEGIQFLELSEKVNALRLYDGGVIEFYKNGNIVYKIDQPKEHT